MDNLLQAKTINLSYGKLTTGVSVKPWSGINKHDGEGVGLFDTVLSHEDYEMM